MSFGVYGAPSCHCGQCAAANPIESGIWTQLIGGAVDLVGQGIDAAAGGPQKRRRAAKAKAEAERLSAEAAAVQAQIDRARAPRRPAAPVAPKRQPWLLKPAVLGVPPLAWMILGGTGLYVALRTEAPDA